MANDPPASVDPGNDDHRALLESLAREAYERCRPDDTFADLKRRMPFSKEAAGLYRDWMTIAAARAATATAPRAGRLMSVAAE
jgi:hypothetical protein